MNRKKLFSSLALLGFTLFLSTESLHAARIPFFFSYDAEKIIKIADFPDTADFQWKKSVFIDAGYKFKQVRLFGIPLWNYDGMYCGYVGKEDQFLQVDQPKLFELAKRGGVSLPDSPSLPFWDFLGGKLLVIFIIGGLLALKFFWSAKDSAGES